jgi:CRP-like cAMP-binding protein
MIALCEGDVALGLRRNTGEFRVDRHLCGPAWLEVSAGWLGSAQAQDALALSEALLLVLPRQAIAAWAGESAGLWGVFGSVLARELADAASRNQDLMHKDAGARLASWLSRMASGDPTSGARPRVVLPTIKRDLASQLAITPETLSRLMRRFSEAGLIRVSGYTVYLLDLAGLRRCALATL